jgi:hypothetical protein
MDLQTRQFANLKGRAERTRAQGSDGGRAVTVMTRNVYIGTALDPIFAARTPEALLSATATAFGNVQATNFPARAQALAGEIAAAQPDLVGLQEGRDHQDRPWLTRRRPPTWSPTTSSAARGARGTRSGVHACGDQRQRGCRGTERARTRRARDRSRRHPRPRAHAQEGQEGAGAELLDQPHAADARRADHAPTRLVGPSTSSSAAGVCDSSTRTSSRRPLPSRSRRRTSSSPDRPTPDCRSSSSATSTRPRKAPERRRTPTCSQQASRMPGTRPSREPPASPAATRPTCSTRSRRSTAGSISCSSVAARATRATTRGNATTTADFWPRGPRSSATSQPTGSSRRVCGPPTTGAWSPRCDRRTGAAGPGLAGGARPLVGGARPLVGADALRAADQPDDSPRPRSLLDRPAALSAGDPIELTLGRLLVSSIGAANLWLTLLSTRFHPDT